MEALNHRPRLEINPEKMKIIRDGAGRFSNFKVKAKRFLKSVMFWSFMIGMVYGSFQVGKQWTTPEYVKAQEVITEVPIKAAVMERIAQCESGKKQFNAQGKLLKNKNTNGTVDVGYYQINTVHFLNAMEMGYDLTEEKGNRAFAEEYLYPNFGTEPWYSSKSCWNK